LVFCEAATDHTFRESLVKLPCEFARETPDNEYEFDIVRGGGRKTLHRSMSSGPLSNLLKQRLALRLWRANLDDYQRGFALSVWATATRTAHADGCGEIPEQGLQFTDAPCSYGAIGGFGDEPAGKKTDHLRKRIKPQLTEFSPFRFTHTSLWSIFHPIRAPQLAKAFHREGRFSHKLEALGRRVSQNLFSFLFGLLPATPLQRQFELEISQQSHCKLAPAGE
jgi:hypothetical protein